MSTYAQITIHSEKSKMNKTNGQISRGRQIKGGSFAFPNGHNKKGQNSFQISYLKDAQKSVPEAKNASNYESTGQKIKLKDEIYDTNQFRLECVEQNQKDLKTKDSNTFESTAYPSIFYKKTTMRSVLKQITFPQSCKALPPNDERSPLIHQILTNLFNQITIYIFNILIAEDPCTNSFYVFFSDAEIIPFTKCCNSLVFIQIKNNSTGKILCNGKHCPHKNLVQFLINYEDSKKIWKDLTYINTAPQKDAALKEQIAKYIKNGKYKGYKLKSLICQTSKLVSEQFYSKEKQQNSQKFHQFNDIFMTNAPNKPEKEQKTKSFIINQEEALELTEIEDKNIESLKMKIKYISKRQPNLQSKFVRSIVDDGKIFNKQFDMSEKIDQIMRKTKHSHNSTYLSFPRLMDQMRSQQKRRNISFTKGSTFQY